MEIKLNHVGYKYHANSPREKQVLTDINVNFPSEKITAIIGKTGSGKSTLIKLLNGLELPTEGTIQIEHQKITAKSKKNQLRSIQKQVGMIFQFSENQLFAETVIKDVMFGPINFGKSEGEAKQLAEKWLSKVNISPDLFEKSPFDLSGGQMKRVALAGVLACEPQVLVLDEPNVGLDYVNNQQLMQLLKKLQIKEQLTIIMVTHSMDMVAEIADYVVVLEKGMITDNTTQKKLFNQMKDKINLPTVSKFYLKLMKGHLVKELPLTKKELLDRLHRQFGEVKINE